MTHVPLRELPEFARNVRSVLKLLPHKGGAVVVHLVGDLGAGKTSFVQTIARDFGIEDNVMSPTYTLMRSYDIPEDRLASGAKRRFKRLVHIDAYRLEKPLEWHQLKPEEFLEEYGTIVFIEWPEKVAGVGPKPDLTLLFSADSLNENARDIEMRGDI
jgi:tRNA threonylcarbamoyladenosine biosynthesis protein TsaE